MSRMFGIPIAFVVGYAVARWFGDAIKACIELIAKELGDWF